MGLMVLAGRRCGCRRSRSQLRQKPVRSRVRCDCRKWVLPLCMPFGGTWDLRRH